MRLTCLTCGHQLELMAGAGEAPRCVCGRPYVVPRHALRVEPGPAAAERARTRAFRAAGVAHDSGGLALYTALLGLVCFPLGLLGALGGAYVLLCLRGPRARYSGRRAAAWAVAIGLLTFACEGALAWNWLRAGNSGAPPLAWYPRPHGDHRGTGQGVAPGARHRVGHQPLQRGKN